MVLPWKSSFHFFNKNHHHYTNQFLGHRWGNALFTTFFYDTFKVFGEIWGHVTKRDILIELLKRDPFTTDVTEVTLSKPCNCSCLAQVERTQTTASLSSSPVLRHVLGPQKNDMAKSKNPEENRAEQNFVVLLILLNVLFIIIIIAVATS